MNQLKERHHGDLEYSDLLTELVDSCKIERYLKRQQ